MLIHVLVTNLYLFNTFQDKEHKWVPRPLKKKENAYTFLQQQTHDILYLVIL